MTTKTYNKENLNWLNTVFLISSPIIAALGTYAWLQVDGFSWQIIALAVVFYYLTGLGITVGYHRLFSHRSYKAGSFLKLMALIFGGCALQNSALKWCNDHRVHHGKVDTDLDPYNINEGFFYAHMGWILLSENIDDYKYSRDLLNDKLVMLQHKFYLPMIVVFGFLMPALIGHFAFDSFLGGLFVAGFARVVLVHHCTFFINSLCHMIGNRPYDAQQTARDSWFIALFSFGEGYHNFHHTFQSDYRNGIRWYHFDPSKWLIALCAKLGLAWDLKVTRDVDIMAKMIITNLQSVENIGRFEEIRVAITNKSKEIIEELKQMKERKDIGRQELIMQLESLLNQSRALVAKA